MPKLKITKGGETVTLEVAPELAQATDEQIIGYVNETLKPQPAISKNDFQVERTVEGILVHPAPVFG